MKEDWKHRTFKDICTSIEDGDWIEKKDQSSIGIRLIQTGNIGVGEYKDKSEKAKHITEDTFRKLKCTEVIEGDILISRLPDPVGRACIVPHLPTKCITAVDCSILKIKHDIVLPQWFIYYTQSSEYFSLVRKECSGTTRDRISRKKLEVINIPIPSLSEQQRIVGILNAEFEKIDALKVNAEKNLQNAKDLFQAALKKELEPKDGWTTTKLGSVCEYVKEQGVYPNLPYIGMENIASSSGQLLGTIPGDSIKSSSFHFLPGDVLYGRLRPYLKKVLVAEFEGCCSTEIFPIRTLMCIPEYLQYWFLSDTVTNNINATCSGCRMPRANMNSVSDFIITFPDKSKQSEIVNKVNIIRNNVITLQDNYTQTIALCDDLKQALLRKAFSGEL